MKHYVIEFSRGRGSIEGYCISFGESKQEAILSAAKLCRKQNNIPKGVHLNHHILFEHSDGNIVQDFFDKLKENAMIDPPTSN